MQNAYDLKPGAEQKKSLFSAEPGDILTPVLLNGSRWRRAIPAYLWLLWQIIQLHFMRKADVVVLNYLPLWNVFFFLLVPKTIILGPITGGGPINSRHLGLSGWRLISVILTRNVIIPFLYKISALIIRWRSLQVKPGTPAVNLALGFSEALPRFIETDYVSIQAADSLNAIAKRSVDVIAYIGPHVLKNSQLTIHVVNSLASDGYKVILLGTMEPDIKINNKIKHYSNVNHKTVLHMMSKSRTLLSLSLEQAGFFSFEAAASGCTVLCLPNSGGAKLPHAVLLAEDNEQVSVGLLAARCKAAIKMVRELSSQTASNVAAETKRVHKFAKAFFYQNI